MNEEGCLLLPEILKGENIFYSKDVPVIFFTPYTRSVERIDFIFWGLFVCVRERVCMEVVRGSLSSSPNIPAALEKTGWVTSGYISWRLTHARKLRRTKNSIVISSLEDLETSLTLNRSAQQTPSSGFCLSPFPTPYLSYLNKGP